ncbi:MAG: hypothetical protein KDB90_10205 [Planctomycetes bacterium]|nr:hypothetical protein [Planctomycetota bacterium]
MAQIWQLSANYQGITATGTVNGFPCMSADTGESGESGFTTAPLNPLLIGKGNVLRIEVTAKTKDATLNCSVEDAMTGDVIDTGNAAEIKLPDGDPPHVIEIKFDSPQDGFTKLLASAKSSDEKTVTEYALKLRDLLNAKDFDALKKELRPKFELLAESFGHPIEAMLGQVGEMLQAFSSKKHEFEAADVKAVPCCDNKLWQLTAAKDGKALIRIEEEDGMMSLDAVVAVLEDGPAIVL